MDSYVIKLGTCNCGSCITFDHMIAKDRAKCCNCPAEYEIHIDLTYIPTLEEWELHYQEQRVSLMEEEPDLPF